MLRKVAKKWRSVNAGIRPFPDFIVIGAQKSGTRSLRHYLKTHPDIMMAYSPETHFFDLSWERGEKVYRSDFPIKKKGKIYGEVSPYYFYHPLVPFRIQSMIPSCKFIVLLRDPVERAFSHYRMQWSRGQESRTIIESYKYYMGEVEKAEKQLISGEIRKSTIHRRFSYLQRGEYAKLLLRWYALFDRSQFLLINSRDFFEETELAMQHIWDFLELEHHPVKEQKIYNEGSRTLELNADERKFLEKYFDKSNQELKKITGIDFNYK